MRRSAMLIACALETAFVALGAQQPATPQAPVFRGAVDVIRLDVSVTDKDHRPVRGLTADDFTVIEEGKPQRIVAVTEIEALSNDPMPSAWMRHVPRDTAANDLVDQIGDGRLFAIVMDDFNLPWDDTDIMMSARATARYLLDSLGPSDIAAIVFPMDAGRTVEFTQDHEALNRAIDTFDPHQAPWVDPNATGPAPGGDMQRFSTALMRSLCQRRQPTVPALHVLASRLATIPNRRKSIFLVTTGVPIDYGARRGCEEMLASEMKEVLSLAQHSNINVHSIDPAGYNGYENYLKNPFLQARRFPPAPAVNPAMATRLRRDFMEITAEETGARAVTNTNEVEKGIDQIFSEESAYYLIGYQTSNGKPDGKFRKVQVKVNKPDVMVRSRSGYYAANEDSLATPESKLMPASSDLGMTGMTSAPGLPLIAAATPLALAPGRAASHEAIVGVVLTARLPPPQRTLQETLTVTRNVYDGDGRAGPPSQEKWPMTLQPPAGDALKYDVYYKLTLAPGRYQLRLNAHSLALDKAGTVFADVDVPDFTKNPVTLSGISLGARAAEGVVRADALAQVLPIVPTSARDFAPSDPVTAVVRVYQGGAAPVAPAAITLRLLDVKDAVIFEKNDTIAAGAFDSLRGAAWQVDLPLDHLAHGPYLLSISADAAGAPTARRDVVFKVR